MAEKSEPFFFPTISSCSSDNRETHTVVTDLDGGLLLEESSFPYFALVAFETGGLLRLLVLLLLTPLAPSFSATFFRVRLRPRPRLCLPCRRQTLEHQLGGARGASKVLRLRSAGRRVACLLRVRAEVCGDGEPEGDGGTIREGLFGRRCGGGELAWSV
ncbi:hypothetical protein HPP92_020362 [Vanilla planifolia]|uniref:Glycerol-3-phosphate acyltransferase RAM2/GPAT1-8 HAD-like domain-containing protein n=1 Tax=Vanilla planifolia TaxID=51239 RepID=A0A835Q402_VANPL|nr:hypothetical protein HPP92_020362 [Vanilla planifolia]